MLKDRYSVGQTKDHLSYWKPKTSFDGRVAQIIVKNTALYEITVRLWHPDSRSPFKAYTVKGRAQSILEYNGSPVNLGSDWGIQIGADKSPVRTLSDVSEWKNSGNRFYWYLTPDTYFNRNP